MTTLLDSIVEWLIESGLMDVLSDLITNFSVELIVALFTLIVGLLGNAMTWMVGLIGAVATAIITAIVGILAAIAVLVLYIFHSIGLMRLAKKLEVKRSWMAWIPYVKYYLLGACAEKSQMRNGKKPWKWGLILLFVTLGTTIGQPVVQLAVSIVLSVLPMLSVIINLVLESASLILLVVNTYCLYLIFKEFLGKTGGIVMAVCSAVTIWFEGIFLFAMSFFKLRPAQTPDVQDESVVAVVEAE